jgi:hypothetical protein
MGRLAVLFLFILIYSPQLDCSTSSESLAPHAIKGVIDGYFAKKVKDVLAINFGTTNEKASKVIEECLKFAGSSMPIINYRDKRQNINGFYQLYRPSILFFDSPVNFAENLKWILFQRGLILSAPHLVYIHGASLDDIQIAEKKWDTIHKTIFLVNETPHSIELATAFLFTPQACHTNQFKVINRFTRTQMRWENSNFFMLKNGNLHGCPLIMGTSGFINIDLYSRFAKALNFTMEKPEGDITSVSFHFGYFYEANHYLTEIHILDIEPRKIFIPPGEVYGDYEKMMLPFDTATWIGIVLAVLVCSSVIFLIKMFNATNQEIFFGRNNESPFMNFVAVLLNGGQHTTLLENVPRMFLLTFIFWSLIFRQESSLKNLSY